MNNLDFMLINLPEDIENNIIFGDYDKATDLIKLYLTRNIPSLLKNRLIYEMEIIENLKSEYVYNFKQIFKIFEDNIIDFSLNEFSFLKDERFLDWIYLNGESFYHKRALENTLKVYPAIRQRLKYPYDDKSEKYTKSVVEEMIEKGNSKYRFDIKTGLSIKKDAFQPMKPLNVYLPLVNTGRNMKNININKFSLLPEFISPIGYPQRTAYFKEHLNYQIPFTVEFSFESHVNYIKLDSNKTISTRANFYLQEEVPHLIFTPLLKNLASEIIGDEKNPIMKARLIYNYITQNVQYSFMRNYGSIKNISEYGALNLKGDCGVQSLLFIALCRIVGIPSKWQSGMMVNPYKISPHDWAEFYVEPYGWVYADLSFGGMALRLGNRDLWDFYFGNIDPFRLVFNNEFYYDFYPKNHMLRSDPYDNQLGEAYYNDMKINNCDLNYIHEIINYEKLS